MLNAGLSCLDFSLLNLPQAIILALVSSSPLPLRKKVTVFDFSEILERTKKRVGEEFLGAGPQNGRAASFCRTRLLNEKKVIRPRAIIMPTITVRSSTAAQAINANVSALVATTWPPWGDRWHPSRFRPSRRGAGPLPNSGTPYPTRPLQVRS
jgi:hypothetical protein